MLVLTIQNITLMLIQKGGQGIRSHYTVYRILHLRAIPTRATYNRPTGIGRFPSANSGQGNTIGGQILNMFNTESWPILQRIGCGLWRILSPYPHTDCGGIGD